MNPKVKLAHNEITVVHRSDGSGTTAVFTEYLNGVSPDWKSKVGAGTAVQWPVGIGGKGNEGVAQYTQSTPNSIGYVEFAYAVQNKMTYTLLKNGAGTAEEPFLPLARECPRKEFLAHRRCNLYPPGTGKAGSQ